MLPNIAEGNPYYASYLERVILLLLWERTARTLRREWIDQYSSAGDDDEREKQDGLVILS